MRALSWLLAIALAVTAACRRDDDKKATREEPAASAAPATAGERMSRRRPRLPSLAAPGTEAPAPAAPTGDGTPTTGEPGATGDDGGVPTLREARDQHIADTTARVSREVMQKAGTPIPERRPGSPVRVNGRLDMDKMRAMEEALRKRAAERKQGGGKAHWKPEPKVPKAPPPTAPAPTP